MALIVKTDPLFTPKDVKEINRELKKYDQPERQEKPEIPAENAIKSSSVFTIPCIEVMNMMSGFITQIRKCNAEYFGFDLYEYYDLDYYNYNVYNPGEEYEWHDDSAPDMHNLDMKLTCILNLSEEPYTGGDLLVQDNTDMIHNPAPGGIVIFPSFSLHKVTPVISGKRITLSYWATGPKWK